MTYSTFLTFPCFFYEGILLYFPQNRTEDFKSLLIVHLICSIFLKTETLAGGDTYWGVGMSAHMGGFLGLKFHKQRLFFGTFFLNIGFG